MDEHVVQGIINIWLFAHLMCAVAFGRSQGSRLGENKAEFSSQKLSMVVIQFRIRLAEINK